MTGLHQAAPAESFTSQWLRRRFVPHGVAILATGWTFSRRVFKRRPVVGFLAAVAVGTVVDLVVMGSWEALLKAKGVY